MKYQIERAAINMSFKDLRTRYVVDVATKLFLERGIAEVTIKDIAIEAEIGEATIYRHFLKKANIVLAVVLKLKEKVFGGYFDLSKGKTGFEKVEMFYYSYLRIFEKSPEYFYFISEFDAYMQMEEGTSLEEYEKEVDTFKTQFLEIYSEGIKDGSIKKVDDIEVFYLSTTHSLLELCKKLSAKVAFLKQDKTNKKADELECLIKIILNSLKA